MKPHIKRDRWRPDGWICRSSEISRVFPSWLGRFRKTVYAGTGSTPQAAYLDWYFRVHFRGGYDAGRVSLC